MEILYREGELEEVSGAGEQEEGVCLTERQSIPDDGGQLGDGEIPGHQVLHLVNNRQGPLLSQQREL